MGRSSWLVVVLAACSSTPAPEGRSPAVVIGPPTAPSATAPSATAPSPTAPSPTAPSAAAADADADPPVRPQPERPKPRPSSMRLIGILSAPSSGVAPKVMLVDDDGKGWIMNEGEVWSGEILVRVGNDHALFRSVADGSERTLRLNAQP